MDLGAGVEAIIRASTPSSGTLLGSNGPLASGAVTGTTTNDNATAGYVGEVISSAALIGAAISLSSGITSNITSISLTAGDWDLTAGIGFTGSGTASVTRLTGSIYTTNSGLSNLPGSQWQAVYPGGSLLFNVQDIYAGIGPVRASLGSTTTYYLNFNAAFSSTASGFGVIRARRIR